MVGALVGPIQLDIVNLSDEKKVISEVELSVTGNMIHLGKNKNTEQFRLVAPKYQIRQLQGLNTWEEVFWLNGSSTLDFNADYVIRGFYALSFKEPVFMQNSSYAMIDVEAIPISSSPRMLFERDYVQVNKLDTTFQLGDILVDFSAGTHSHTYNNSYDKLAINTNLQETRKRVGTAVQEDYTAPTGVVGWSNVSYIVEAGGTNAEARNNDANVWYDSEYIVASNFGFTLDADASIVGLSARASCNQSQSNDPRIWSVVKLRKPVGTYTQEKSLSLWNGWHEYIWGSETTTWGLTWTPAEINNSTMRIYFRVGGIRPTHYVNVDWLDLIVNWRYTTGTYTSVTITHPADGSAWNQLVVSDTIPAGCSIHYDVLRASDNVVLLSDQHGPIINLSGLAFVDLKLRCEMVGVSSLSPTVNSMEVSYTRS